MNVYIYMHIYRYVESSFPKHNLLTGMALIAFWKRALQILTSEYEELFSKNALSAIPKKMGLKCQSQVHRLGLGKEHFICVHTSIFTYL